MPTKDSQRTEDMLDQTFANFDTEVTGAQTQQTQAEESSAPQFEKKKSSNMMVFVGAGVAAVGSVAYLFVIKPMLNPAQMPVQTAAPQAVTQQPQEQGVQQVSQQEVQEQQSLLQAIPETAPQLPQEVSTSPIIAQEPVQTEVQIANLGGIQPPEGLVIPGQGQLANDPSLLAQNNTVPIPEVQVVAPQVPVEAINTNNVNVQVPIENVEANHQSVAAIDELKNMFDRQTVEFKDTLTGIDERVNKIENSISEQQEFNKKVDQRLNDLEKEKKSVPAKVTKKTVVRRKTVVNKPMEKKEDPSVLVNKSGESARPVVEKAKIETKTEKVNLPHIKMHSVYNGRLWVKNTDGSLSTYTVGDRLLTGEIIKSIDDSNFEVITDKRVIRN